MNKEIIRKLKCFPWIHHNLPCLPPHVCWGTTGFGSVRFHCFTSSSPVRIGIEEVVWHGLLWDLSGRHDWSGNSRKHEENVGKCHEGNPTHCSCRSLSWHLRTSFSQYPHGPPGILCYLCVYKVCILTYNIDMLRTFLNVCGYIFKQYMISTQQECKLHMFSFLFFLFFRAMIFHITINLIW